MQGQVTDCPFTFYGGQIHFWAAPLSLFASVRRTSLAPHARGNVNGHPMAEDGCDILRALFAPLKCVSDPTDHFGPGSREREKK